MLTQVTVKGVRSLEDVTVDLAPFTFIVGPNGCGKSTLLDQIERVCRCSWPGDGFSPMGTAGPELADLERRGDFTHGLDGALQLSAVGPGGFWVSVDCDIPRGPNAGDPATRSVGVAGRGIALVDEVTIHQEVDLSTVEGTLSRMRWSAQRLRLSPPALRLPVDTRQSDLAPTGFGLAAVLMDLALNDHDTYARVQSDLRRIVPAFEKLHIERQSIKDDKGVERGAVSVELVMRGAGRQPARSISDGTLLALALLTATHHPDLPSIVLMDDIDHGLHLPAQFALVKAIRAVQEVRPELQVICTTHSPYLLDAAKPEEVRVMALDAKGRSHIRPLTDHPRFAKEIRGLQTGEFWATFGEDWVVEGSSDAA